MPYRVPCISRHADAPDRFLGPALQFPTWRERSGAVRCKCIWWGLSGAAISDWAPSFCLTYAAQDDTLHFLGA
jgi:hypothetical protein